MPGCLRRVGCAALIVLLIGGAYLLRHRWLPFVTPGGRATVADSSWKPLSADGAQRARRAIGRLDSVDGPVFSNVDAADFAAYVLDSAVRGISAGARPAEAATKGDRIFIRTTLRVADLGVENVPLLGSAAGKTVTMVIGGTLRLQRPGFGELLVKEIIVDAIDLPGPATPRVTRAIAARLNRSGTRGDALGFTLPALIADVRVQKGVITLYKAAR